MRFVYANSDHARASAKELRKVLAAYGRDASLTDCQATLAKGLGYETWAELKLASTQPGRVPSPFDVDASPAEVAARAVSLREAVSKAFGFDDGYAEGVVRAVSATSGGRAPPVRHDLRIGDPSVPGKEYAETLVYDVPRMEGFLQVGTLVAGEAGYRRYKAIYLDPQGELWTPVGGCGNRYLDTVGALGGYTNYLLQNHRSNELAGCGNAIPELHGEHLHARLGLLLRSVIPKLAWSAEHGLMRLTSPSYRVRIDKGVSSVKAAIDVSPPTDLPSRYGTLAEAKDSIVMLGLAKHAGDPLITVEGRIDMDAKYLVGPTTADMVRAMCEAYAVEARFLPAGSRATVERFVSGMTERESHDADAIMDMASFENDLCKVEPGFVPATSDGQATRGALSIRGLVEKIIESRAVASVPGI